MDGITAEIILQEVRRGFEAVNDRLDQINGTVRRHGEQIAVLDRRATDAEDTGLRNYDKLDEMQHQFLLHRARCPFDQGGSTTPDASDEHVLTMARKIRRQRAFAFAGVGAAAAAGTIELIRAILGWWRP